MKRFNSLKQYRQKWLDLTQETIGDRAGLSVTSISMLERGCQPAETNVEMLASAYRLTVAEFWTLFRREGIERDETKSGGGDAAATGTAAVTAGGLSGPGGMASADLGALAEAGR